MKLLRQLAIAMRTVGATLREIFDESSYQRFLESAGLTSSRHSYQAFLREREQGQARKHRCC